MPPREKPLLPKKPGSSKKTGSDRPPSPRPPKAKKPASSKTSNPDRPPSQSQPSDDISLRDLPTGFWAEPEQIPPRHAAPSTQQTTQPDEETDDFWNESGPYGNQMTSFYSHSLPRIPADSQPWHEYMPPDPNTYPKVYNETTERAILWPQEPVLGGIEYSTNAEPDDWLTVGQPAPGVAQTQSALYDPNYLAAYQPTQGYHPQNMPETGPQRSPTHDPIHEAAMDRTLDVYSMIRLPVPQNLLSILPETSAQRVPAPRQQRDRHSAAHSPWYEFEEELLRSLVPLKNEPRFGLRPDWTWIGELLLRTPNECQGKWEQMKKQERKRKRRAGLLK